jgi:hypothetical protein
MDSVKTVTVILRDELSHAINFKMSAELSPLAVAHSTFRLQTRHIPKFLIMKVMLRCRFYME